MTRWAVMFSDGPEMAAIRAEREPAHLAYLDAHREMILMAGGLREEPGAAFLGGLWIVEAPTRADVAALIERDPYFQSGARQATIRFWGRAFPEPVTL
jgi:hypothetical protein